MGGGLEATRREIDVSAGGEWGVSGAWIEGLRRACQLYIMFGETGQWDKDERREVA